MKEIGVKTNERAQMLDITAEVSRVVSESGISEGKVTVFVPHTTAGITINENADPDVTADILTGLERIVPRDSGYLHCEGNADSHIKASMMGFSVSALVSSGYLVLGTWQGIYFCEFDGPRNRRVYIAITSGE